MGSLCPNCGSRTIAAKELTEAANELLGAVIDAIGVEGNMDAEIACERLRYLSSAHGRFVILKNRHDKDLAALKNFINAFDVFSAMNVEFDYPAHLRAPLLEAHRAMRAAADVARDRANRP